MHVVTEADQRTRHELKTWQPYFQDVLDGGKTFEVRRADRPFAVGDVLWLREFMPVFAGKSSTHAKAWGHPVGQFSGRTLEREITYMLPGGQFGIEDGYVVLGLAEPLKLGAEPVKAPPRTLSKPNGHPADGMTVRVPVGDGAVHEIIDPRSFEDGGLEWTMRYGNPETVRYSAASIIDSYDYLLSDHITLTEATRRLRILRQYRAACVSDLQSK